MLRPLNFGYCLGVAQFYQNCPFPPTTFLMEPGKPKFWTGNSSSRPHFWGCQVSCVDVLHNDNLSEPLLSIKRGWRLCMCSSYVFKFIYIYILYIYIIYSGFTQKLSTPNSCGLSYVSSSGCNEFGLLGSPPPLLCIHSAASLAAACGWVLCFVVNTYEILQSIRSNQASVQLYLELMKGWAQTSEQCQKSIPKSLIMVGSK